MEDKSRITLTLSKYWAWFRLIWSGLFIAWYAKAGFLYHPVPLIIFTIIISIYILELVFLSTLEIDNEKMYFDSIPIDCQEIVDLKDVGMLNFFYLKFTTFSNKTYYVQLKPKNIVRSFFLSFKGEELRNPGEILYDLLSRKGVIPEDKLKTLLKNNGWD